MATFDEEDQTNYYQNPVEDYIKPMPDNLTYPAYSLIPKDRLKDPKRIIPYDVDPLDWKTGDTATDAERQQRKMVRNYTKQLFEQAAKSGDITEARKEAERKTSLANIGEGLEGMFKSRSVSVGGPGVDKSYWESQRMRAQQGVENAELDRKRKIEEYITKKRLGSEAVGEQQKTKDLDLKNKMFDPESEISRYYQDFFKSTYGSSFPNRVDPETGDEYNPVDMMSANDILQASKMLEGKSRMDMTKELEMAKIAASGKGPTDVLNPKTQAEIETIKAESGLIKARTDKEKAAPAATPKSKAYESVDRDYAKDYNDWTTNGRADFQKNMSQLEQAKKEMEEIERQGKGGSITGKSQAIMGKLSGDLLRSSEGLKLQSKVESAVIGSLKATVGSGQITDSERQAVLSKAWDSRLPLKDNIEKVDSIINDMKNRAIRNEQKAKYFESQGTLGGMKTEGVVGESSQGPYGPRVKQDGVWYNWNSQTKQYEEEKGVK